MAKEPRWARAFLAAKMYERWTHGTKDRVDYRVVASPSLLDTLYVFVFVPNAFPSVTEYRQARQQYLRDYCFLVASKHRRYRRVLGIASEAGEEPYRTFDVVILEGDRWTPEMESSAADIQKELEVSGEGPVHRFTDRPLLPPTRIATELASHHQSASRVKVGRNEPCPCGSGKKFKRCCLRRPR
ncbi:MAG: SEC-C domain-containing protein [Pirellulales bacterium]|nr:SEC-C domain-containing protein [Pirellulales bacterium]